MKTVAIILAGGSGTRMGTNIPKQFLKINGKPIIVWTIENFQKNSKIDSILVSCNLVYIEHMKKLVDEYHLDKVEWVIPGGKTSSDSTSNGVFQLKNVLGEGDYVIIHDAVRPILPQKAIDDMLEVAKEHGNASLAIPCYETVLLTEDGISGKTQIDRSKVMRVQTPQAYLYAEILSMYERVKKEDRNDFVYANLIYINYGKSIYFSKGFINNIKITKSEDLVLCESLMKFNEDQLYN
jgi:2-C-methyl-D-erythritol 4-phosphate cytidylyltransferase